MYLSKLGFFKNKIALEKQQLLNYLNLLTANLKSNNLKKIQLAYLQQGLFLLTASAKRVKQKRISTKLNYTIRKRKLKKRLTQRVKQMVGKRPIEIRILAYNPEFARIETNKKSPKHRIRTNLHP
ncbi:hypothetical protein [Legionella micdadei]|uniref:Uncharacterized protein n=1 Tax=Legionella micdadei TaxID=451 RepID=A0A098GCY8_LEGMI|nr:hypothetical protein [Legionella micdadei]ARG98023.1 hypothetical protein B6N58_10320 [Legionella micdadei]ARH00819.1 hypothetical protein B6V88_10540 [Legionella micdadei]KTD30154.1 hypothetical protein Lmic_0335 [Legionella micdadei]NSL18471.1 hypothetical protein [Legionella micdadei]CEG60349.1 protein of unknown function [Legionella micdadei]